MCGCLLCIYVRVYIWFLCADIRAVYAGLLCSYTYSQWSRAASAVCVCEEHLCVFSSWQSCLKVGRLQICSAFSWSSYLLSPPVKDWIEPTVVHTHHAHTRTLLFSCSFFLLRVHSILFHPCVVVFLSVTWNFSPSLSANGAEPKTNYHRQSFQHEIPTSSSQLSSPLSLIVLSPPTLLCSYSHIMATRTHSNSIPWSPFCGEWLLLSECNLEVFLVSTRGVNVHMVCMSVH